MSVRGRAPPKPARGSIFGTAIGSPRGGFWGALTESPPRTPQMLVMVVMCLSVDMIRLERLSPDRVACFR